MTLELAVVVPLADFECRNRMMWREIAWVHGKDGLCQVSRLSASVNSAGAAGPYPATATSNRSISTSDQYSLAALTSLALVPVKSDDEPRT